MIKFNNVSFAYENDKVLENVKLDIEQSQFVIVCGQSGSGKTTLLRLLKEELKPAGVMTGTIEIGCENQRIGIVGQNPESQIVTGKVWQELAFGLENVGCDRSTMERKITEIAEYFGIRDWYFRDTATLSGGQKQLLNLAAVMVMEPEILLLDEPGAQLDTIAYESFLSKVEKIRQEFGTTVILVEHRLDMSIGFADQLIALEMGKIIAKGAPKSAIKQLYCVKLPFCKGLPAQVRLFYESQYLCGLQKTKIDENACPLTLREGKMWISDNNCGKLESRPKIDGEKSKIAIKCSELTLAFDGKECLNDLDLEVRAGEIFAIFGGNGAGKSTLLNIIAGAIKPKRGKVKCTGRISGVGQNPMASFTETTVLEELTVIEKDTNTVNSMLERLGLEKYINQHPYDLSGGQMQRLALGKALLLRPDILLLDEPTKGLDALALERLGELLKSLGITILMVSHDIEFCGKYADRGAFMFGGRLVAQEDIAKLISENRFYTTTFCKMAGKLYPGIINVDDYLERAGEMYEKA